MYKLIKIIMQTYFRLLFGISYTGEENLPKGGGYLLCSNHVSAYDPLILACSHVSECSFLAKTELFSLPLIRYIARSVNIVPIKRGTGDIGAIRKAISLINTNKILIVFPEGTRSKDGKLGEGKNGAVLIAKKTGCPIVPCSINSKPKLFHKIKVAYGKPVDISPYAESKNLNDATKKIMSDISELVYE